MTVVINGTTGISPVSAAGTSASIDGLTVGRGAGEVATNTAVGTSALNANTTGARNTALGNLALAGNTTTTYSDATAIGYNALYQGGGGKSTAIGSGALSGELAAGGTNTAVGYNALTSDSSGGSNVAIGVQALQANTTASNNTAVGYQAGYSNVAATDNTFIGYQAGYSSNRSSGAPANVCVGSLAGYGLTTGYRNTFIGPQTSGVGSGYYVTTGFNNTIIGGYNGNQGGLDIRTASNYIVLSDGDGTPRIWHTNQGTYGYFVAPSIYNNTTGSGANVFVTSAGELYRSTSSLKYKTDVQDATHGLAEVMTLRPVTYKGNNDGDTVFGGLIAEEVHEAGLTEFVQYADDGSPDALAYGNMVSLAIKAIQELKAEFDAYKEAHP